MNATTIDNAGLFAQFINEELASQGDTSERRVLRQRAVETTAERLLALGSEGIDKLMRRSTTTHVSGDGTPISVVDPTQLVEGFGDDGLEGFASSDDVDGTPQMAKGILTTMVGLIGTNWAEVYGYTPTTGNIRAVWKAGCRVHKWGSKLAPTPKGNKNAAKLADIARALCFR